MRLTIATAGLLILARAAAAQDARLSPAELEQLRALLAATAEPWYGTPAAWAFLALTTALTGVVGLLGRWVWRLGSRIVDLPAQVLEAIEQHGLALERGHRAQLRSNVYLKAAWRLLVHAAPEDSHVRHVQNEVTREIEELTR